MLRRYLFCLFLLFGCTQVETGPTIPKPTPIPQPAPLPQLDPPAQEALDEVNQARAKKGLQPFQKDDGLTLGAMRAASYRARNNIAGHTRNDFAFLPDGCTAKAAGCGALEDSWGWQSCAVYDRYSYAGAAWSRGKDGLRYMHLFVR